VRVCALALPLCVAGALASACASHEADEDGLDAAAVELDGSPPIAPRDAADAPATRDSATPDTGTTAAGDAAPSDGGSEAMPEPPYALDCGASAYVLESAGPPENRVNYVIVGDGYSEAELPTRYRAHLDEMLRVRFLPELEPYSRYRKFINICALQVPSQSSGIGEAAGNTAFGGYGNDQTRLGYVQEDKVRAAIKRLLPPQIEVDWTAIVLNSDRWWNAGGRYMVWSGAHEDAGLAAMHEGGHSFQLLADEYGGSCTFSGNESDLRVNVTKDGSASAGKWTRWLDATQTPGTGRQGLFEGAQYCDKGAYRPSQDSVMNSLWRSSYFNAISLEQAVRVIYGMVRPIDRASPADLHTPATLFVKVVDPQVVHSEWFVDDEPRPRASGPTLDVSALGLTPGSHGIRVRAFDDTPWVQGDRSTLEQTLRWTIEVP